MLPKPEVGAMIREYTNPLLEKTVFATKHNEQRQVAQNQFKKDVIKIVEILDEKRNSLFGVS